MFTIIGVNCLSHSIFNAENETQFNCLITLNLRFLLIIYAYFAVIRVSHRCGDDFSSSSLSIKEKGKTYTYESINTFILLFEGMAVNFED